MSLRRILGTVVIASFVAATTVCAQQTLTAQQKTMVEAKLKQLQKWGSDSVIVKAVKEMNANPPAEGKGMTQDKWKDLPVVSPEVKFFTKNPLAEYLKTKKDDVISEAFISCADGTKAAFLAKTTNWCHKGKPKHDLPMTNKTWMGPPELDQSSGVFQVQVSFPVLDAGKPIGSIVVGLDISKL